MPPYLDERDCVAPWGMGIVVVFDELEMTLPLKPKYAVPGERERVRKVHVGGVGCR